MESSPRASGGLFYHQTSSTEAIIGKPIPWPNRFLSKDTYADSEAMNLHLEEIGRAVAPGAHAILVLDGAGWHTSHALDPPDNVTLLCLPPYSPELNPIENVWEYLRKNNLALRIHDTDDAIVDACCKAWTDLLATPKRIASITSRRWAQLS